MKTLILHIGPHKTGSTYIQKKLLDNSKQLENNGWMYPSVGLVHFGQHELATIGGINDDDLWREALNSNKNIVISSENFDRLNEEQVKLLAVKLSDFVVKIVYLYRRGDEKLISSWQESIKHGGVKNWSEYLYYHVSKPYLSDILGDIRMLENFKRVFGSNSINIIDYDVAKRDNSDLFELFIDLLGVSLDEFELNNESINKTSDLINIEILRRLNILDVENGNKPFHFLREKYFKHISYNKCEDNNKIHDMINNQTINLDLGDNFIFDMLRNQFYSHFDGAVVNGEKIFPLNSGNLYQLPSDDYLNDVNSLESIRRIYKAISS
jgi:hypothetical protein